MRVLLVHNRYRLAGGEESAVLQIEAGLRARGHDVAVYTRESRDWDGVGEVGRIAMAAETIFSRKSYGEVSTEIDRFRPDVVHVHNIFPFVSPSVYYAAVRKRVPVVQTLHNFRFFCMNGLMFRDGRSCELCLGGNPLAGVVHGCYQGSRAKSAIAATTLIAHRGAGTWARKISAFIALSHFSRTKYITAGFPEERISVIRNSVRTGDPANRPDGGRATSFLFIGRLSEEKGLPILLAADAAYRKAGGLAPLVIAGDGPLMDQVLAHKRLHPDSSIRVTGRVDGGAKGALFAEASHVLFPTACFENCPFVVLESLAAGVPVIGSRIGGVPELIEEGKTGWLVPSGDAPALADAMRSAGEDRGSWEEMSEACREDAASRFNEKRWIEETEAVYRSVFNRVQAPTERAI